jgi:hypothetical protein
VFVVEGDKYVCRQVKDDDDDDDDDDEELCLSFPVLGMLMVFLSPSCVNFCYNRIY